MPATVTTVPPTARRSAWWPAPLPLAGVQRLRMSVGALVGIGITAVVSQALPASATLGWIVAPMGASAVLLFCLPASPLAQPWSVVGGNTVAALVGVACARWLAPPELAAAIAVAGAIAAMFMLRCLHPPGGATALLVVLTGTTTPAAALMPVLANSVVLTAAAWIYHRVTRHDYPHRAAPPQPGSVTEEDLNAVLARYTDVLDVSRDDLRELLDRTQRIAHERRLATTRCADVMTRDVTTVEYGTALQEAWTLLRKRGLKTLPVLDRGRHVVGIVTLTDFLEAASLDVHHGFDQRLRGFMRPTSTTHTDKPEVVGHIMTRKVRVTRPHRTLSDLVVLFDSTGHRHIPVVAEDGKLVGVVTQSDVIAALKMTDRLDGVDAA